MSADTKDERMLWCGKLNEALQNVRAWHSDALRPIKRKDFVSPYNPYAGNSAAGARAEQRTGIVPFNPHDQQSAV